MDWHHPDRENLFRLVLGNSSPEETHRIERHLSDCRDCRDLVDEISSSLGPCLLDSWLLPGYDEAFENAADRASERLALILQEAPTAEALLAELLRRPAAERRSLVQNDERFHVLKLCQFLESRSRDLWVSDPFAALEYAELAVGIAARLSPLSYGSTVVEDVRAMAWGFLGNSYRVCSDFWKAEQAFLTAWRHHVLAGEDAYTEGELLSFTASLRTAQGRFDEAVRVLDRAVAIYREGGDDHLEARGLIQKGSAFGYMGEFSKATQLLRQVLSKVDPFDDPHLILAGHHNLLWYLHEEGKYREALRILLKRRSLYQELGDRTHQVRLRWLEGKIARDSGRLREAAMSLEEVREIFIGWGLGADAAFASLDLAFVYSKEGNLERLRSLVDEMIPIFESRKLYIEANVARLIFDRSGL